MSQEYVIAYVDKSVVKISGLRIKGLDTQAVEKTLSEKLSAFVRVIGVTGDEIQMDVYNIDPEAVRRNARGLIEAVALTEGVTATEVAELSCSDKIIEVDLENLPDLPGSGCARERWMERP